MIQVQFPPHLTRHFPVPNDCQASGETVAEVISDLERQYPGVASYLIHENGALRQHVNIFLGEKLIGDRRRLSDSTSGIEKIFVMQALSGG